MAAVYDDLTIDLGLMKVSVTGSDAGHNGVASLLEHLGNGFARLRLGIGPKQPPEMDMKDFVLARFTSEQLNTIQQKTDYYVQSLELLAHERPRTGDEPAEPKRPPMNEPTKRNYRATFIVDNRGKQETVEQIVDGVKKEIAAIHGDVTAVENIGKRDFARVTDRKFTGASYVHVNFSAPPEGPAQLRERLRLNGSIYSTFVQKV